MPTYSKNSHTRLVQGRNQWLTGIRGWVEQGTGAPWDHLNEYAGELLTLQLLYHLLWLSDHLQLRLLAFAAMSQRHGEGGQVPLNTQRPDQLPGELSKLEGHRARRHLQSVPS